MLGSLSSLIILARGSGLVSNYLVGLWPGELISLYTGQRPDDDAHERDAREIIRELNRPIPSAGAGKG